MNRLETRGVVNLLERIIPHLVKYDREIPNGGSCDQCGAYGGGAIEQHKPDCKGKKLYHETVHAMMLLAKECDE